MTTIKHFKNENVKIEISKKEFHEFIVATNNLKRTIDTAQEASDLWLSDVKNLEELKWKLTELLGLTFDRDTWGYVQNTTKE